MLAHRCGAITAVPSMGDHYHANVGMDGNIALPQLSILGSMSNSGYTLVAAAQTEMVAGMRCVDSGGKPC